MLNLGSRGLVGSGHTRSEMPCSLLGICGDLSEAPVQLAPPRMGGGAVDGGGEEGMRETEPLPVGEENPRLLSRE